MYTVVQVLGKISDIVQKSDGLENYQIDEMSLFIKRSQEK